MAYTEMNTVPEYEQAIWENGKCVNPDGVIKWGRAAAPPEIGARIFVTINNCGPAVVTGYFVEGGWLGLRCRLLNPPEWHIKQNKGNPLGHVFGPEYRAL